jgi:exodeoxyribonuclease-5
VDEGSLYFSAVVSEEEFNSIGRTGGPMARARVCASTKGHFEDHVALDRYRHDRDWKDKRLLIEAPSVGRSPATKRKARSG